MNASPFSQKLNPTHAGRDWLGRRVLLVQVGSAFLTRTEAKARMSGFTREEGIYRDVVPLP